MQRLILSILLVSILVLSGLWYWHAAERKVLEQQFINNQIETIFKPKQQQIEKVFNSLYQNIRTISLLPSVQKIQGDNRHDDAEDIVASGRFTEEGQETVQQVYNNLAVNVSVSEIYAVLDGLDANKGQIPFFMFDTLKFGEKVVEEETAINPDFPEESEAAEYSYFPTQMQNIKSAYAHFNFKQMEDIPAFISPMMRTCDNTQYLSKATGNEHETFGILYSVPFYNQKTGDFKGVISAIIRANAFEAALLNIPFVPITDQDKGQQQKDNWQLPKTSRFMLSNASYDIHINDRRNTTVAQDLLHGKTERNVFRAQLNVHSDAPWELSYYLPESMIQEALAQNDQAFYVLVAVVMGVLLIALFAVILVTRMRTKLGGNPETVAQAATQIAKGDLAADIALVKGDKSSLLYVLKSMRDQFREVVENVRLNADSLASVAQEISATSQALSQSAIEQASGVEVTTSSVEELNASVQQNVENAKNTNAVANTSARAAEKGCEAVNLTVDAMRDIASKISLIEDIAYRTNLLSLNASIEAATAGEHGKGFTVVASEVRKLAENSRVTAQEISELTIKSVEIAEEAGKLLNYIVPNIQKTADLVEEVTNASEEQSSGINQINVAMNQLDQATQQNASMSEQLAATAEEMSGQAEQLQQAVAFFRLE